MTAVLTTKVAPDGRNVCPEPSNMRRGGEVLQTPGGQRGAEEEGAHTVAGLVPGVHFVPAMVMRREGGVLQRVAPG